MARPLRIEYPGAFYHVMNRGQRQEAIYEDDADRQRFVLGLGRMCQQFGTRIHAYCLMNNHYHLILETPDANLSRAMQWLNVSYASYFNHRHRYAGHLFQGRFKALVVEAGEYLEALSRYVHLNPVRAGLAERPWDYPWSSCRAFVKSQKTPDWLDLTRTLDGFGNTPRAARHRYKAYLAAEKVENPGEAITGGSLLGSASFIDWITSTLLADRSDNNAVAALKRVRPAPSVEKVVALVSEHFRIPEATILRRGAKGNDARDVAIYLCRQHSRRSGKELGKVFGHISGAAITMRYKALAERRTKNRKLKTQIAKIERQISNS